MPAPAARQSFNNQPTVRLCSEHLAPTQGWKSTFLRFNRFPSYDHPFPCRDKRILQAKSSIALYSVARKGHICGDRVLQGPGLKPRGKNTGLAREQTAKIPPSQRGMTVICVQELDTIATSRASPFACLRQRFKTVKVAVLFSFESNQLSRFTDYRKLEEGKHHTKRG